MTKLLSVSIVNLQWSRPSKSVSWAYGGTIVSKSYSYPIASVNLLRGGSGAAIVEPIEHSGPRNAVIFNADGSERCRIELPFPDSQVQGFADMYYIQDELTAVAVTPGRDFAVVVDASNGKCLRSYETR